MNAYKSINKIYPKWVFLTECVIIQRCLFWTKSYPDEHVWSLWLGTLELNTKWHFGTFIIDQSYFLAWLGTSHFGVVENRRYSFFIMWKRQTLSNHLGIIEFAYHTLFLKWYISTLSHFHQILFFISLSKNLI